MINGKLGRIIFICSLLVAAFMVGLETLIAFHPGVAQPSDIHTVLIATLAFSAGAAGINPGTK